MTWPQAFSLIVPCTFNGLRSELHCYLLCQTSFDSLLYPCLSTNRLRELSYYVMLGNRKALLEGRTGSRRPSSLKLGAAVVRPSKSKIAHKKEPSVDIVVVRD